MRPAFRRGWEGEGKPKSMPWRGPAGHARHTGVSIPVWEREGEALGVHAQTSEQRRSGAHRDVQRITNHGALATARRRRVMCRQAECTTRPPAQSAAPPSKRAPGAHPARREASAPAGQLKNAAPSGAPSDVPLIITAPDRHPDGPGLQARSAPADRAGRPKGSAPCVKIIGAQRLQ